MTIPRHWLRGTYTRSRILRVEILDPIAVGKASSHEAGGRIEHMFVIARSIHQHFVVVGVVHFPGKQRHGIVIVRVSRVLVTPALLWSRQRLLHVWIRNVALAHVFPNERLLPPSTVALRRRR